MILRDAALGIRRFEDFQDSLGIASNVLSTRLRLLCDEGVLERRPHDERPGRPEYVLTEVGSDLHCGRCGKHVGADEFELRPGPGLNRRCG